MRDKRHTSRKQKGPNLATIPFVKDLLERTEMLPDRQFSVKAGVHNQAMLNFRKGKSPRVSTFYRLCEAAGLDVILVEKEKK